MHGKLVNAIALVAALLGAVAVRVAPASTEHFSVEKLAEGVYAVIQNDPLGLANHANSVFIVGERDVIVVDSQFTLERTREVLAAIRAVTSKPVGMLINTHWHDDHFFGNQVYKEAFPGLEIVSHPLTKADLEGVAVENRSNEAAGAADALKRFKTAIATRVALDGSPMSDDEKAAYQSTVAIGQEWLDDTKVFQNTLPTKTFERRMVAKSGTRTVELRHFAPAVSRGDVAVWLPKEKILVAGDLVDNPVPFAYRADVDGWIASLDSLTALNADVVVPGHGKIMRGSSSNIPVLRGYLVSLREQTRKGAADGKTLEQTRQAIDLRGKDVFKEKMLQFIFESYFVDPVVGSVYKQQTDAQSHGD